MFRILFEKGYLFLEFLFYVFGEFIILGQKLRFYSDEIFGQSLFSSSLINSSITYVFCLSVLKFLSACLIFSCTSGVQNHTCERGMLIEGSRTSFPSLTSRIS